MSPAGLFRRAIQMLEVPGTNSVYINDDIRPLPPSRRTWGRSTFIWFWLATSINLGGLTGASSILSLGLNVWQAVLTDLIGSCIICFALVANGDQGGRWHIPFAIGNRAPWGIRGAWFVVANRLILSFCWYGVQSWWGGQVVKVMIACIWPGFYTMKNHFPESAHMTTSDFIGFIIFWTISLPLLAIKPERYRYPALASSIFTTGAVIALLIWALAKQGNGGPLLYSTHKTIGVPQLEGAALGWAMARSVTTTLGGWAGAILYQSDYSRYARRPGDQVMGQIFVIPVCMVLSSFIGLIITSCAAGIYPDEPLLWKTYKLMEVIQTKAGSDGARAAMFFLALAFFFSQICVNIAGNAVTGGIDLATLIPKFVDTRRGPFIVAIVGFAITPWNLVNTANTFIIVLSSYSTLLSPLTGIMVSDYFFVRHRRIRLSHIYTPDASSIYWFWNGLNPRAILVWVLAVFPSFPGFLSSVSNGKIKVPIGWVHTQYLAWPLGFTLAATLWWALSILWPPPGLGEVDDRDVFGTFTELPAGRAEGVAEEELSGKGSQHGGEEEEAVESRKWAEVGEELP